MPAYAGVAVHRLQEEKFLDQFYRSLKRLIFQHRITKGQMKYYGGLPDQEHAPYKIIAHNPHIKDVVRSFRLSDYAVIFGNAAFWTGGYLIMGLFLCACCYGVEKYKPTTNPKAIPLQMTLMVPFFLAMGISMASMRVHGRFWGVSENAREVKMWKESGREFNKEESGDWMVHDW